MRISWGILDRKIECIRNEVDKAFMLLLSTLSQFLIHWFVSWSCSRVHSTSAEIQKILWHKNHSNWWWRCSVSCNDASLLVSGCLFILMTLIPSSYSSLSYFCNFPSEFASYSSRNRYFWLNLKKSSRTPLFVDVCSRHARKPILSLSRDRSVNTKWFKESDFHLSWVSFWRNTQRVLFFFIKGKQHLLQVKLIRLEIKGMNKTNRTIGVNYWVLMITVSDFPVHSLWQLSHTRRRTGLDWWIFLSSAFCLKETTRVNRQGMCLCFLSCLKSHSILCRHRDFRVILSLSSENTMRLEITPSCLTTFTPVFLWCILKNVVFWQDVLSRLITLRLHCSLSSRYLRFTSCFFDLCTLALLCIFDDSKHEGVVTLKLFSLNYCIIPMFPLIPSSHPFLRVVPSKDDEDL
jgi:hypothetical protein